MKKINNTSRFAIVILLLLTIACSKKETELALSRQFAPAKISSTNAETQVSLTWSAALFTIAGDVSYAIEISDKVDDFSNPIYTTTTSDLTVTITDETLVIKKNYYARVKAVGKGNTGDSNWLISSSFRILGEQFLAPVTIDNVIDKSVRLTWRQSPDLTKIVITPTAGGTPIEVSLTAADLTAMVKQVDNLAQKTAYTAEIFAGAKTKGVIPFTTKPSISGNIIDLSGTTGNPGILATTLTTAPSGSVIVLRRGEPYTMSASFSFGKSLTIISALGFGNNLATIRMADPSTVATTVSFNFVASSVIDSLVFKDLVIKGGRANLGGYNADYVFNASNAATITKIKFDNCTIKVLRGILRLTATGGGGQVTNFSMNNCLMDSIREFNIVTAGTSVIQNIAITNSTLYKARKFIGLTIAGNKSISISNCTFNEMVAGVAAATPANFFIDLGSTSINSLPNGISITNTILGNVWSNEPSTTGPGTVIGGIRAGTQTPIVVTNTYTTSDFVNTTNPVPGVSAYSGAATALFTDPSTGNFKIKDSNFVGKASSGDPRWR